MVVSTSYLITKSVTADYNRVFPARDRTGNLFEDDGFTEHRSTQDVTNLVRRQVTYMAEQINTSEGS